MKREETLDMLMKSFDMVDLIQSELQDAGVTKEDDDLDQLIAETKDAIWLKVIEIKELLKK